MTIEEAIKTIELAVYEVQQEYRMDFAAAFDVAISALRAKQEKENNAPLTLDEMREMGGEPYYHVSLQGGENHWAVLDPFVSENIDVYDYGYGKRWIAYRHKPEEESHV